VSRTSPPRDELAIKLAMAVTVPGVDVREVVQAQRRHSVRALQDYTRLKARALAAEQSGERPEGGPSDADSDLAWLLVLEQLIFQTEAEVRWLDHCESRLARQRPAPAPAAVDAPAASRQPAGMTRRRGARSGRA
jgi:virulence activator alpha